MSFSIHLKRKNIIIQYINHKKKLNGVKTMNKNPVKNNNGLNKFTLVNKIILTPYLFQLFKSIFRKFSKLFISSEKYLENKYAWFNDFTPSKSLILS